MKFKSIYILLIFFLIIYSFFPTVNSTIDSYYYAACVKYGKDLFLPHHLLYNAFGYVLYKIVSLTGFKPDVLAFMKILNAIAAVGTLYFFARILKELKRETTQIILITFAAGSCFGFMRFATENENYIIPILFSMIGSLYFVKFINNNKSRYLFYTSLWASIACLFHQIHIFWWIGILIGLLVYYRKLKYFLIYSAVAIIVPITYISIFTIINNNQFVFIDFCKFIVRDFTTGNVSHNFGLSPIILNLILSVINLFRTFFQVHGLIFPLFNQSLYYFIPIVTFLIGIVFILYYLNKSEKRHTDIYKPFINTLKYIFLLHFIFAFFSVGNAEFMVMLSFLFLLIVSETNKINNKAYLIFGVMLFIWNFAYGIFPLNHYNYNNDSKICNLIVSQPKNKFILRDYNLITNKIYYTYGKEISMNLLKPPSDLKAKNRPLSNLDKQIKLTITRKNKVYTDCITPISVYSRASIFENEVNIIFFRKYGLIIYDTISTNIGSQKICEVKLK